MSGLDPQGGHHISSHFNVSAPQNKQEMEGYQEHTGEDKSEMLEISKNIKDDQMRKSGKKWVYRVERYRREQRENLEQNSLNEEQMKKDKKGGWWMKEWRASS